MDRELLKKKVCDAIDANRDKIYEIGRSIYSKPELGYKEVFASETVKKTFDELGLKYEDGLGITGVKAKLFEKADFSALWNENYNHSNEQHHPHD